MQKQFKILCQLPLNVPLVMRTIRCTCTPSLMDMTSLASEILPPFVCLQNAQNLPSELVQKIHARRGQWCSQLLALCNNYITITITLSFFCTNYHHRYPLNYKLHYHYHYHYPLSYKQHYNYHYHYHYFNH